MQTRFIRLHNDFNSWLLLSYRDKGPDMKLIPIPPDRVINALEKLGFKKVRQKGSHVVMQKIGNPRPIIIPVHKNRNIDKPLLRMIINEAGVEKDEFLKMV